VRAAPGVRRMEAAVHAAARSLLHVPPAAGGDFGAGDGVAAAAAAQIALPLRHGGLGLRVLRKREVDAACLSAAALTHAAMEDARPSSHPFDGPLRAGLAGTWECVFDDAAVGTWLAAARALSPAVVHDMLPGGATPTHMRGRRPRWHCLPGTFQRRH
jgi:hypothetical protein